MRKTKPKMSQGRCASGANVRKPATNPSATAARPSAEPESQRSVWPRRLVHHAAAYGQQGCVRGLPTSPAQQRDCPTCGGRGGVEPALGDRHRARRDGDQDDGPAELVRRGRRGQMRGQHRDELVLATLLGGQDDVPDQPVVRSGGDRSGEAFAGKTCRAKPEIVSSKRMIGYVANQKDTR